MDDDDEAGKNDDDEVDKNDDQTTVDNPNKKVDKNLINYSSNNLIQDCIELILYLDQYHHWQICTTIINFLQDNFSIYKNLFMLIKYDINMKLGLSEQSSTLLNYKQQQQQEEVEQTDYLHGLEMKYLYKYQLYNDLQYKISLNPQLSQLNIFYQALLYTYNHGKITKAYNLLYQCLKQDYSSLEFAYQLIIAIYDVTILKRKEQDPSFQSLYNQELQQLLLHSINIFQSLTEYNILDQYSYIIALKIKYVELLTFLHKTQAIKSYINEFKTLLQHQSHLIKTYDQLRLYKLISNFYLSLKM